MGCINSTRSSSSPNRDFHITDTVSSPRQQLQSLLSDCNTLMEQIDNAIPTYGEGLRIIKYNALQLKIDIEREIVGEGTNQLDNLTNTLQRVRQDFNAICFREINQNQFRYSGEIE